MTKTIITRFFSIKHFWLYDEFTLTGQSEKIRLNVNNFKKVRKICQAGEGGGQQKHFSSHFLIKRVLGRLQKSCQQECEQIIIFKKS